MELTLQRSKYWTPIGRVVVFILAASSIACLLSDFYRLCPMRWFTLVIFLPALAVLAALTFLDLRQGDGQLCRAVLLGAAGGLLAAFAYDVFRLPFVFAREWRLTPLVPHMDLFKVFPRFGAMILGQPLEQAQYSLWAKLLGWSYHFSNGATFGVMYVALVGNVTRRHWAWAVVMALGLEAGMLLTPYPQIFRIAITPRFIAATLAAHAVFGIVLGLSLRPLARGLGQAIPASL